MTYSNTARTAPLDRRAAVLGIVEGRRDLLAVASLGSPTYDLAAAGDHERNFYLWGAMGGAATFGLGLALAQPEVPVLVLLGDGECLMGLGALATIAVQRPSNLSIVVLDNGLYGETGAQRSHTSGGLTKLDQVARACGISETMCVETEAQVRELAERVNHRGAGPLVAVVRINGEEQPRCLPSRDGVALKTRMRHALGLESM
ncbi:aldehyde dehydrogenase [Roseomonas nepalensis]|uniref:Aldehyde dehydrogenase n=1 Tax=Muricoccus nepalensis TaxID=1854500 RepID=A0A502GCS2_9PROT|nr:thiamine pyrophosphate-dependent enzyme [Roseomonas nepalensis]TPG59654.1 aldehyde dehydrogenase [Roseomonas nepalensis]